MSHARIIDHFGDEWTVFQIRDTVHSFPLLLGFPSGHPRGKGCGGPKIIMTSELAAYLEGHRRSGLKSIDLPIGDSVLKRMRKQLGHHRNRDTQAWWNERIDDLQSMTLAAFAAKHGVTTGAAEYARLAMFGKTNRDNGWWRSEPARSALLSDRSAASIAAELGIADSTVGRLRVTLKADRDENETTTNGRLTNGQNASDHGSPTR